VATTALACLAGLALQCAHVLEAVPHSWLPRPLARFGDTWPDYSWIAPYVHPGDVVVTSDYYAIRSVPGFGAKTIPPAWPDPFLPDQRLRWHELAVIHDPRTDPATRQALLTKYHARWVLEVPGSWSISAGQTPVAVGPLGQRLYRLAGS
jgi:alpha-1,6-mannosyltransferase